MITGALILFLLTAIGIAAQAPAAAFDFQPKFEVLIPQGMPIKIEVKRDEREPHIAKYIIKRIVPVDARRASIIAVLVDHDGEIKIIDPMVGDRLTDPMTLATADKSISRILLIVEWLETGNGRWILDNKTRKFDIKSVVKMGAKELPCAKFTKSSA